MQCARIYTMINDRQLFFKLILVRFIYSAMIEQYRRVVLPLVSIGLYFVWEPKPVVS